MIRMLSLLAAAASPFCAAFPRPPPHPLATHCRLPSFHPAPQAGKDDGDERWKVGGPLVPDLDTAVARYPCTIVKLEGGERGAAF